MRLHLRQRHLDIANLGFYSHRDCIVTVFDVHVYRGSAGTVQLCRVVLVSEMRRSPHSALALLVALVGTARLRGDRFVAY